MTRLPTEEQILKAVQKSGRGPVRARALAEQLGVSRQGYRDFRDQLRKLVQAGKLYRVKGGRYAPPDRISLFTGMLSLTRRGDGFVAGGGGKEVFVPARDLDTAMDGDRVVVRIESRPAKRSPVGRVIKVLERAHPTLVAVFHQGRRIGYGVPLNPRLGPDVSIPWGDENGAEEGDVVLVRITAYGTRRHGPTGEVEKVLGQQGDPGVDILSILYNHGLAHDFPPAVEAEAREAADAWREGAGSGGREDLRQEYVFTIDPADAKDHDDALSIEPLKGGGWRVGIHIADVSHFVPRGGAVDQEAYRRATSVYLVDRVIPMLPHALSSDACSLRPDGDRFAVSLHVELAPDGEVRRHEFCRSVIRSRHRLAYEEVQAVMDGGSSVNAEADAAIFGLRDAARALRARKTERGALDLDLPEARVVLDEEGAPVDIVRVDRLEAHRLVEDFMLLANEVVARDCQRLELPALYRVHEQPSREKLDALRDLLGTFGIQLPRGKVRPGDLAGVLDQVRGRPEEQLVATVVLRSLQRARYDPECLGHFGLALTHYAHFTSPIRRYPDLVTHRVVIRALAEGGRVPDEWQDGLEEAAEQSSLREQAATQAERDSVDLKKIEYMERHLGDEFDGTVSGVTAFGAFVLLDQVFVEGLIHVNALTDDYYEFREREYALVGSRQGRRFRIGDRVRIQVARVDRVERHIDFVLVEGTSAV